MQPNQPDSHIQIRALLREMPGREASDLHLVPGHPPVCRIHGRLTPVGETLVDEEASAKMIQSVVPEALHFAYEAVVADTDLAASRIEIEELAARATCCDCGKEAPVKEFPALCPACGGVRLDLHGGMELRVENVVLADDNENAGE